jgi:hypothetical protein
MHIFELEHYIIYLQGEKVCICRLAEVLSPQITKKIGSQSVTFAEGPQI